MPSNSSQLAPGEARYLVMSVIPGLMLTLPLLSCAGKPSQARITEAQC